RSGRADAKRRRRAAADERRDAAIAREVDRRGRTAPEVAGETLAGLEDRARQTLARLGELVERDASLTDTLTTVLDIATDVVEGAGAVTITLTIEGRLEPAVSSATWAAELDAVQVRHGVGAIPDAIAGRAVVVSSDLSADERWQLADAVGPTGRRGVSSVPFIAGHAAPGALTVYAEPGAIVSREAVLGATLLAAQLSVAVGLAIERMSHRAQTEAWQRALASRDLIGQAKGILMAYHGVSADAAFDLMRATSQQQNTKVRDVAAAVVIDRQLPEPPDPSGSS
ncbi:MAG: GAF and ANTAR domain-containing protein, partial [Caldilineaceae bacterium]|nr:GAF and ANTAR domain-containing protein [Caldilineaceae bacterium]